MKSRASGTRHRGLSPLRCWHCGERLNVARHDALECQHRHLYRAPEGVFDLLPPATALPPVDTYSTPVGWFYDRVISRPRLAAAAGWAGWGADMQRMYRLMDEAVVSSRDEVLLDIPAGSGISFARRASQLRGLLVGLDLSLAMLARASRARHALGLQAKILLARADATQLPLLDQSVDRALCFNGFHVIPNKAAVLTELRRVLRPGGSLVGTCLSTEAPLPWALNIQLTRMTGFFVPPSASQLAASARQAGFKHWEAHSAGAMLYFRAS